MKWNDVVVKPAVSAGSFKTRRFRSADVAEIAEGRLFLRDLLTDRDAMVQKYMPSVEDEGEKALVWIDGEFTHAVEVTEVFGRRRTGVGRAHDRPGNLRWPGRRWRGLPKDSLWTRRRGEGRGRKVCCVGIGADRPSLFLKQHPRRWSGLSPRSRGSRRRRRPSHSPWSRCLPTPRPAERSSYTPGLPR